MRTFYICLIMLIWLGLTGFTLFQLLLGSLFASALFALLPSVPATRPRLLPFAKWPKLAANVFAFTWDFIKDLTLSNIDIATDVWHPRPTYKPAIVEVPVSDLTPFEIYFIATRITLTPGTLSADVSADGRILYVHAMHPPDDPTALRKPIDMLKDGLL